MDSAPSTAYPQKHAAVAAEIVKAVESGEKVNATEILRRSGYAPLNAGKRGRGTQVLQSNGVKKALEVEGFTEENAKKAVADILLGSRQERNRLDAADKVFKVFGSYVKENASEVNVTIQIDI